MSIGCGVLGHFLAWAGVSMGGQRLSPPRRSKWTTLPARNFYTGVIVAHNPGSRRLTDPTEEIIRILREVDNGQSVEAVCREAQHHRNELLPLEEEV